MQVALSKNNGEKKTVLFVDDEKIVLEVGSLMLQKLGYSVITANNGYEAIEIIKENKIDFVILDVRMPDMNGFDIFPRLKNINPNVKILLASGCVGDYSEEGIFNSGFDGFVQKPFNLKQLSEKIEYILEN